MVATPYLCMHLFKAKARLLIGKTENMTCLKSRTFLKSRYMYLIHVLCIKSRYMSLTCLKSKYMSQVKLHVSPNPYAGTILSSSKASSVRPVLRLLHCILVRCSVLQCLAVC